MFKRLALDPQEKPLTEGELRAIEKYADTLFAKLQIDVQFTRHFIERLNDPRNRKQITVSELAKFFKEAYLKYGQAIDKMKPEQEAVLCDAETWINMPFVIQRDPRTRKFELVNKTVMRKRDFKSPDPILKF